jgi:hypothetical protein
MPTPTAIGVPIITAIFSFDQNDALHATLLLHAILDETQMYCHL